MLRNNSNKKIFTFAIFLIGILLLLSYLVINFLPTGEQHLHGGGFKEAETSINIEAGIMEPKEIGVPDIEIKVEEKKEEIKTIKNK